MVCLIYHTKVSLIRTFYPYLPYGVFVHILYLVPLLVQKHFDDQVSIGVVSRAVVGDWTARDAQSAHHWWSMDGRVEV